MKWIEVGGKEWILKKSLKFAIKYYSYASEYYIYTSDYGVYREGAYIKFFDTLAQAKAKAEKLYKKAKKGKQNEMGTA